MRRYLHREGRRIIATSILIAVVAAVAAVRFLPLWLSVTILVLVLFKVFFVCRFFRVPVRCLPPECAEDPMTVLAPADGTVVAIEEVYEDEILSEKRIQVSIFMSIWNIHINWYPVSGLVEYFRHHPGKFLVAWHPKSSTDNERTTTVVRMESGHRILFRQIAGFVARRIVSYAHNGLEAERGRECGFIKFGSRVDVFLPLGSEVRVELGQKTTGMRTPLAQLPKTAAAE
ncbi:MAG TPA: phosphatidylserine decarboxylase family protein [Candidatus Rikenella faecigallinarum]|uniref:Phosphatidylserine decarboxylase proenzyme n=1 Tax=Candidatus Rikenella faecigallinarum TaxID=2838745 RepID=A0A9D1QBU3_9BACT|nr:phosphatidylserine decarboxylase family protein [Candidatus Rikenella faecigallinarum]